MATIHATHRNAVHKIGAGNVSSDRKKLTRRELILIAVTVLIVSIGKAWTVATYAPLALGDNGGFVEGADEVLANSEWLSNARLDEQTAPNTLWRPIGYILIIAAMKSVFADHWAFATGAFQALLSPGTGLLLFRLCVTANLGIWLSVLAFIAPMVDTDVHRCIDNAGFTDRFVRDFGLHAGFAPDRARRSPLYTTFLVRRLPCRGMFLNPRGVFFRRACFGRRHLYIIDPIGRLARRPIVFSRSFTPNTNHSVHTQVWNFERTGHAVITTSGQTGYTYALLRAAKFDPRSCQVILNSLRSFVEIIQHTTIKMCVASLQTYSKIMD